MKRYKIGELLKACNAYKEKGVSAVKLFVFMLQLAPVFSSIRLVYQASLARSNVGSLNSNGLNLEMG